MSLSSRFLISEIDNSRAASHALCTLDSAKLLQQLAPSNVPHNVSPDGHRDFPLFIQCAEGQLILIVTAEKRELQLKTASIILACGHVSGAFSYLLIDAMGCTISIQVL